MNTLAGRRFDRILLIKPSSPGDILHALPVARAIRAAWPDAHLAWLVATPFASLLEVEPSVNELIRFDRRHFAHVGFRWGPTRDFAAFVRELRARRFDLVLDLQGLVRSGFMAWACGARVRIGFRDAREAAWIFYSHHLPRRSGDEHAAERNMLALDALGIPRGKSDFRPTITDADRDAARALLPQRDAPCALLVPSTRWETKRWPAERFGQLASKLRATHGLSGVLVGGADDAPLGRRAANASNGAAVDLCGKTTLRELAALVAAARVVVTADSTPMHMAAAFGRPLVALFGPTNPARTGPFGRPSDVVRLDLPCSPCYLRHARQCPYSLRCMNDLSVDAVAAAVAERLAQA